MSCSAINSRAKKRKQHRKNGSQADTNRPNSSPPLIHYEILMKSDRAVPMCLRTMKGRFKMYDKYIERIDQLNEQGRCLALQMLDDLLSNKKNRKDYESPRQKFLRETDEVLALVNRESGAMVNDKKVLPLFKKKVPAI